MSTLLVLESVDGVGKSTTAKALHKRLQDLGHKAVLAREPGFTKIGEQIRSELLLSHVKLTSLSIFYLFQVARMEMLEDIRVNHRDAEYIVMDRFWPSTLAYQVYGAGIPYRLYEAVQEEVRKAVSLIGDEIDICLTLPEELRLERIKVSGKGGDRFESKPKDFTDRVTQAYKDMVYKGWLHPVDASADTDAIVDHIVRLYVEH